MWTTVQTSAARPRLCIRTLDTQCGRAFKQQPLVLVFVTERSTLNVDDRSNISRSSSSLYPNARHSMWTSVQTAAARPRLCNRTLDTQYGRAFKQQPLVLVFVTERSTLNVDDRSNISRSSSSLYPNARHSMWTSVQTAAARPRLCNRTLDAQCGRPFKHQPLVLVFVSERSTLNVDEPARPRLCIRTLDTQCGRAFKQQPLVLVFVTERSTLNVDDRSNIRPMFTLEHLV
ncbi:hypothetical protein LR48_Vigan02g259600 [Vigna angularis]|uniref:Uncharacterized protein n=1 Tax=Phaseolus angularis TaxID=3914 RepID=A0A0L9U120_PHAAN|nr:hypothetical protein LR48_Vigan02g259600 [Vigna angularis]